MPNEFADTLKASGLDEFFRDCTAAHRREYLNWITGAKKPDTRMKRIAQAIKMLSAKQAEEAARQFPKARRPGGR